MRCVGGNCAWSDRSDSSLQRSFLTNCSTLTRAEVRGRLESQCLQCSWLPKACASSRASTPTAAPGAGAWAVPCLVWPPTEGNWWIQKANVGLPLPQLPLSPVVLSPAPSSVVVLLHTFPYKAPTPRHHPSPPSCFLLGLPPLATSSRLATLLFARPPLLLPRFQTQPSRSVRRIVTMPHPLWP